MKKILALIIIILNLPAFSATITIDDLVGRKVDIPASPRRIICLSPGTLRLIAYLQATNLVVGVEELEIKNRTGRPYWLADTIMKKLPIISPGGPSGINRIPDLEKILKVKPDLIFVTLLQKEKADEFQRKIGIPVVVLSYGRFASFDKVIFHSINLAGKILGREKRAKDIIQFINNTENDLKTRTQGAKNRSTSFIGGIGFKGGHGIESTDGTYIPFEWLNVNNIAKKIKAEGHFFINKEKLLSLNPEYIFIDGSGKNLVIADYKRKKDFYNTLTAFKNKKVYNLLPFNWYTTNIGSVMINAYGIGKILYPKSFKDVDIRKKGSEIYNFFVGKDVVDIMERDYGRLVQKLF